MRALCIIHLAAVSTTYLVAASPAGTQGARYVALHLALSALRLVIWAGARRSPPGSTSWILATGLLARLVLLAVPPFTSGDAARYLWDGQVLLQGLDPYRLAPQDVASVGAGWPLPADNTSVPTIYPPAALALFAIAAAPGPNLAFWIWKAMVTATALGTLLLLWRLVRQTEHERNLALVALSPLLILEGGVGAHVDVVATLAVALALVLHERGKMAATAGALAVGGLIKLAPLTALAPLLAGAGRRRALLVGGTALAVLAAGYGAALLASLEPVGSLFLFFRKWRFGSPLFGVQPPGTADGAVPLLVLPIGAAGLLLSIWAGRRSFPAGALCALATPLIASPVVFPWYLTPLVPLLAVRPRALPLIWTLTVPLTYEVMDTYARLGTWRPATWPLWIIAAGWVVGAAIDLRRARRPGSASLLP